MVLFLTVSLRLKTQPKMGALKSIILRLKLLLLFKFKSKELILHLNIINYIEQYRINKLTRLLYVQEVMFIFIKRVVLQKWTRLLVNTVLYKIIVHGGGEH